MNLPVYTTETLRVDSCHAESVLESMIHTILFHRVIYKKVKPKEVTNPIYDSLYYVMIDDERLHRMVQEKTKVAVQSLKERKGGTIAVHFYCTRDSGGWLSKKENVVVERWSLPIQWYELYDRSHTMEQKERQIKQVYESLLSVLCTAPVPVYRIESGDIPFDIVDLDKPNMLQDLFQFITSGPPKLGMI